MPSAADQLRRIEAAAAALAHVDEERRVEATGGAVAVDAVTLWDRMGPKERRPYLRPALQVIRALAAMPATPPGTGPVAADEGGGRG